MREAGEEEKPAQTVKPPEQQKSPSSEEFIRKPETREFISSWAARKRDDGEPLYTKRGITALLKVVYPNFDSDKKILAGADEVLKMLGGMDGLQGFLMGWKAKSEGIIKSIKSILG
jgi:hypothetical protein